MLCKEAYLNWPSCCQLVIAHSLVVVESLHVCTSSGPVPVLVKILITLALWITMGAALVGSNFLPIPSKISFHKLWKKKWLVSCSGQYLQNIKTFLTLEQCKFCKSDSMFSSSEPVTACIHCSRLGNSLCLCLPVRPAQAVPASESGPKSLAVDLVL